ncbi:MAG: FtsB family cell division protein [Acidimicrobiia bacterium]
MTRRRAEGRTPRLFWPLVVSVLLVGALFLFVFPTRTWLQQRQQIDAAEARLEVLDDQNRRLSARVNELQTDAEVERIAREQYQLVRPGEEAYAILPAPGAPADEEIASIDENLEPAEEESWWRRAWEWISP